MSMAAFSVYGAWLGLFACIVQSALFAGLNLAVFSLVDSLLFRPIPVARPEEIVRISSLDKQGRLGNLPSTIVDPLKRDPIDPRESCARHHGERAIELLPFGGSATRRRLCLTLDIAARS